MRKLTKEEFRTAIKKGHGRALMHIRTHGDAGLREIILEACLRGKVYDAYVEPPRFHWLKAIIEASGHSDYYVNEVLSALENRMDSIDLDELCGLVAEFVRAGNSRARLALDRAFDERGLGQHEIVALDGLDGLVRAARSFGEPGIEINTRTIVSTAEEQHGKRAVQDALETAAAQSDAAGDFLEELKRLTAEGQIRPAEMAITEVLEAIEECPEGRESKLQSWGWRASDDDIDAILARLGIEQRPEQARRLLRVIGRRPVPNALDDLLRLAKSEDAKLRSAAFRALGRIRNRRCREFAIAELTTRGREAAIDGAIRVLIRNYRAGDHELIAQTISGSLDDDETHSIGLDLLSARRSKFEPERANLLLWLYENGPCAFCRKNVVSRLIKHKRAPDWLREECCFDGHLATRKLIASGRRYRRSVRLAAKSK